MHAMLINQFGDPSVFEKHELAMPDVDPGHILINVAASSVNPVDCKIRQGKLATIAPEFPALLHGDVAGTIVAVGDGVAEFSIGDEVYACAGGVKGCNGALADFMLADAALAAHKPQSLSLAESASLPLVSITAWEAIIERAQLRKGQSVLIHGATGGVSHVAIQLAKWVGAKVFATSSSDEKASIAKQLGADEVIFYQQLDVKSYVETYTKGKGFDVVFDTVGGDNIANSFHAAALNGSVVSVSTRCTQDLSLMHAKGLSLHVVFMLIPLLYNLHRKRHGKILSRIAELVDSGNLQPLIDNHRYTINDVANAHKHLESGAALGKVVLTR